MPAGLHFAGVHGKLVVDIDENSHPGAEFRVSAGGTILRIRLPMVQGYRRKQVEVTYE